MVGGLSCIKRVVRVWLQAAGLVAGEQQVGVGGRPSAHPRTAAATHTYTQQQDRRSPCPCHTAGTHRVRGSASVTICSMWSALRCSAATCALMSARCACSACSCRLSASTFSCASAEAAASNATCASCAPSSRGYAASRSALRTWPVSSAAGCVRGGVMGGGWPSRGARHRAAASEAAGGEWAGWTAADPAHL